VLPKPAAINRIMSAFLETHYHGEKKLFEISYVFRFTVIHISTALSQFIEANFMGSSKIIAPWMKSITLGFILTLYF
jgi:hypothetical protein